MKNFWRNNSLSIVLFAAFFVCLFGQIITGHEVHNEERQEHRQSAVSMPAYLTSGHIGEAVFENWESEFLAVGSIVVLSIFLRQQGSPESKPVAAPHSTTG